MTGDRRLHASERWFRLLLWLYPADFRDEMGEALVETYRDRVRDALKSGGVFRLASVWVASLRDSVRNGIGERVRPAVVWRRSGDWGRDMELVSRRLRQKPLFVLAVLTTLTLGLGTFAVVYTAVDKMLLEPLPYKHPSDLYMVWFKASDELQHLMVTGPQIAELQKAGGLIEGAAGLRTGTATLLLDANTDAMRINLMASSTNLFDLLGVQPALGRGFRPEDGRGDASNVVVLTDTLWKRLGGDSAMLGREITLSGSAFTVIGVMAADFGFSGSWSGNKPAVYVPCCANLASEDPKNSSYTAVIRARRGTRPEEVLRAVDNVGRFVVERDFNSSTGTIFPVGVHAEMLDDERPALVALSFAGLFMVLVLTVNLASLLLSRAAEREREFAISRALGASSPAVIRATVFEGGLLGLIGGITGTLAGMWGTRLLVALGPINLARRETIVLDGGVAAVVIAVGALLGLIAAAVPATWAARVSWASLVSGIAVRGSAGSGRMRRGLIVVQVALSLVLLSSGGLVLRSFQHLSGANPGFRSEGVLTFSFGVASGLYPKDADASAFQDRFDAALRALPGVTAVSSATQLPLSGGGNAAAVQLPGAPGNTGDLEHDRRTVSRIFTRGDYIEAIGMRLVAGTGFELAHRQGVNEAVIDRHLADQFFPNRNPIGGTLVSGTKSMTIVGVVEQARLHHLDRDDSNPQLYVRAEDYENRRPSFYVVRTDRDPRALVPEVRAVIRQMDRRLSLAAIQTMDEIVADKRSRERISAVLISALALGAVILVSMGLFGLISGSVTRRRGELAVRIALGATHQHVVRLVVTEGAWLIALGVAGGIPGIYLAGEALRGFLVGVSPFDTATLGAVAAGLMAIALLACYLAARRVTAIAPDRLLREGG